MLEACLSAPPGLADAICILFAPAWKGKSARQNQREHAQASQHNLTSLYLVASSNTCVEKISVAIQVFTLVIEPHHPPIPCLALLPVLNAGPEEREVVSKEFGKDAKAT